ncbi:MAG: hypothetical protein GY839_17455 [candidate division Zixibacteria bacterium]|nr:hypothetical protein [candidate division Zixibacteria bacterium]
MKNLLSGGEIDRPPISAWNHFYDRETTAEDLADVMLEFQHEYDWDFMKINPRAGYFVEDWGVRFKFGGRPGGKHLRLSSPVSSPADWPAIKPLDPTQGSYGEQLRAVELISNGLVGKLHFFQTIFSPLSIVADLTESDDAFIEMMNPGDNLETALEAVTLTLEKYVEKLMGLGITGIYFATTEWATRKNITEEQYSRYGTPYDLRVLAKAEGAEMNILHVCMGYNMLPMFNGYPFDILSWNKFEPGNMDFAQADKIFSQPFLGGVDHLDTLIKGTPEDVIKQKKESLADAGDHRLIIGPGCTMKLGTKQENIRALREKD